MAGERLVHVVEDDAAVRQSVSFLLASEDLPVQVHETAAAFLESVDPLTTGCVVTDVRMPEIDGIELLRLLKRQGFAVPVIVMTGHADVPLAVEALQEGALEFIGKPFDDEIFLNLVRSALQGQDQVRDESARWAEAKARMDTLSARERQVLESLLAGKGSLVIAQELGVSSETVEICRANLMSKMQARSLSELVRVAVAARSP